MFGRKDSLLGLDIGSHSIKIVQVDTSQSPIKLLNVGLAPVGVEAFVEGRMDKSELVARSIQQLTAHLKIKERPVAASISGYDVMIKKIELPTMTEDELRDRMKLELGQYIPYNIEEVDVDYQILDIAKDRPNYMDVLLVAAKKESVTDYVNLIKLSGLDATVIDVDFFALSNAYEASYGIKGDENIALLDIGSNKALMNIISRGVPLFTRGISMGGSQITDGIRDHFKLSQEDAERFKLEGGGPNCPAAELEMIFVGVVKKWMGEFRRAIDFFYNNFPDSRIDKLYLCGGSCRIPGLDKVFQENADADVEIFNPLTRLNYDANGFDPDYIHYVGPQMAIALGLALRKTRER